MSDSSIMTVGEMIDAAFGDEEGNTVNHKLIQAVLFILARNLRVLERRVQVELGPFFVQSETSLSVTELKIHALQRKRRSTKPNTGDEGKRKSKRGGSISGPSGRPSVGGAGGVEGKGGGGSRGVTQVVAYFIEENRFTRGFGGRGGREAANGGITRGAAGRSSGKRGIESEGKSSEGVIKGTESGRRGTESGIKETDGGIKASENARKRTSGGGKEVTAMRMATIEGTRGRSSVGENDYVQGMPGGAYGKYKSDKIVSGKKTDRSAIDDTVSDKSTRGYKAGTKTLLQPTSSSSKPKSSSSDKAKSTTSSTDFSSSRSGRPEVTVLEEFEIERERQLRIIQQRQDSREEPNKTPTSMASLDSVEAIYEKLLVVERIPSKEAKKRAAMAEKGHTGTITTARVSVVTQEQFASLVNAVKELKQKFEPIGKPEFPENLQLMQELRRGASLTDAMAALQLSARLEATEKTLQRMTILLTDLASTAPGVNLGLLGADGLEVLYGAPDIGSQKSKTDPDGSRKAAFKQQPDSKSKKGTATTTSKASSDESFNVKLPEQRSMYSGATKTTGPASAGDEETEKEKTYVSFPELDESLQKLYDEIMNALNGTTTKSSVTADEVLKAVTKLEEKINSSMNLGNRMVRLEIVTAQYADAINALDTGLSSQMTNYQEELTQMQHDLEMGLETMAEVLADTGGDNPAVGELNAHFSSLQGDIDHTMFMQKELKDTQKGLAIDLEGLRKQIEILREVKSDRDEVVDALRDKADLGALNGIISLEQFDAVRGDFEKRIGMAYDKFNNQEAVWQKAIDDLLRELNEKADYIQLMSLRDDINMHLSDLRAKLNFMIDIVGEPKAAAVTRKIHRDANCLSCSTPAHMELEEVNTVPALPAVRPPAIGAEAPKHKEDHGKSYPPCYPGLPIPHPIDPRAHFCHRWCGGSHTLVPAAAANRTPVEVNVEQLRKPTTMMGTDGKTYKTDEPQKPCISCCIPSPLPSQPEPVGAHVRNKEDTAASSALTPPLDFVPQSIAAFPGESAEVTPPQLHSTSENL